MNYWSHEMLEYFVLLHSFRCYWPSSFYHFEKVTFPNKIEIGKVLMKYLKTTTVTSTLLVRRIRLHLYRILIKPFLDFLFKISSDESLNFSLYFPYYKINCNLNITKTILFYYVCWFYSLEKPCDHIIL